MSTRYPAQYLSTLPYRDNALNSLLTANVPNPYYNLLPGTGMNGQAGRPADSSGTGCLFRLPASDFLFNRT
jgi:hypothetical protein